MPRFKSIKNAIIRFLATGFGAGNIPFAPGTFGTLVAVPLYWLLHTLSPQIYLSMLIIALMVGIAICHAAEKNIGVLDSPTIVWDEIVGYLATMFMAPPGWIWIVLGFILFRLFDIFKPWPVSFFDRSVKGGAGIMLDDIAAGIYAGLSLHVLYFFF